MITLFNLYEFIYFSLKNIKSFVRYAMTQSEKEPDELFNELKHMCISHKFDQDQHVLQLESIIENIVDHMRLIQCMSNLTFLYSFYIHI